MVRNHGGGLEILVVLPAKHEHDQTRSDSNPIQSLWDEDPSFRLNILQNKQIKCRVPGKDEEVVLTIRGLGIVGPFLGRIIQPWVGWRSRPLCLTAAGLRMEPSMTGYSSLSFSVP